MNIEKVIELYDIREQTIIVAKISEIIGKTLRHIAKDYKENMIEIATSIRP